MIDKNDKKALVERSIITKFRKGIWAPFLQAIKQYRLIKEGDNIAVCISGGKDSMLLAKLMQELLKHSDYTFGLKFLCMDPGYNAKNLQKSRITPPFWACPCSFSGPTCSRRQTSSAAIRPAICAHE